MPKILVVDDEPDLEVLIRQKFRRKIRDGQYEFVFAVHGRHALEQLARHDDVAVVLSDINMPEMDGLSLLSAINQQNGLLKSVIVSAYGDMDNIRSAMNLGAFDFVTKPINFEDLEVTIDRTLHHVNALRETMKAIQENNILKMYVNETILNFMGSREFESALVQNETIEASVAFVDICDFTRISEHEAPDEVAALLNDYFDVIVKEIIEHGGYIDKFIGDAAMAVFRGDFHLDRAVDACLAVRGRIADMPALATTVRFTPSVSIGINAGEMISGNFGSHSLRRLDHTVIGDVVNTAQRLQDLARPGQVLINADAYAKIRGSFECRHAGEVTLKNKDGVMAVYEVLG